MNPNVEISFDCLPLRSVPRLDVAFDAPPEFQALAQRVKQALAKHGRHNSYYLHSARYRLCLTNDPNVGMVEFSFEGTVLTDAEDRKAEQVDLAVKVGPETCDWLTEPAVAWFRETVAQAVRVEFDRYIAAGDLERTKQRIAKLEAESDAHLGFLGMGL